MRWYVFIVSILVLCVLLSAEEEKPLPDPRKNTFSIAPLGLLFGGYLVNYERLIKGKHSFLIEGALFSDKPLIKFQGETEGYSGNIQYRYHRQPGLNSKFTGIFIRHLHQNTISKVEDDTLTINTDIIHAGANIGRRWIKPNGFTFCIRIGYGIGYTKLRVRGDGIEESVLEFTKAFSYVFSGLDGEFTIGWAF
jgi:hypothetical protein